MPRKTNNGKRSSSRDSRSIADKLEAIGLGIKFNRIQQNAQNPHSAPFRRTTAKDNYQDPIKDHAVYPGGKKPNQDYAVFIKLYESSRAMVEDNMIEIQDNYWNTNGDNYDINGKGRVNK